VAALAGQATLASIGITFLGNVYISEAAAWLLAVVSVGYGYRQTAAPPQGNRTLQSADTGERAGDRSKAHVEPVERSGATRSRRTGHDDSNGTDGGFLPSLSLIGLWVLFFWLYRDYRVDLFRQRLFALRDELFDLGRTSQIAFHHQAYGLLRTTINGYIRFAHRLSFFVGRAPASAIYKAVMASLPATPFGRLPKALETVDPQVRAQLESIVTRMHFAVFDQLVLTSATNVAGPCPGFALLFFMKAAGVRVLALMRRSRSGTPFGLTPSSRWDALARVVGAEA